MSTNYSIQDNIISVDNVNDFMTVEVINEPFLYQYENDSFENFPKTKKELQMFRDYTIDRIIFINNENMFDDSSIEHRELYQLIDKNPMFQTIYGKLFFDWKTKSENSK